MNQNDRSITAFTMSAHALVHTYELSIPILMTIWLVEFPVTTATLGAIVTVGYALFGIGALPGGILTDRFPAKYIILFCLGGMAASFLLLSTARNVPKIALSLGAWGAAASVYHPAGLSLISTGVDDRGTGFAYHGMAGNVGIAFGPLLTAILLLAFGWRTVSILLTIPAAIGILYALTVDFDEGRRDVASNGSRAGSSERSLSNVPRDARRLVVAGFGVVLVIVLCNGLFYRGTLTFLPDLLSEWLSIDVAGLPGLGAGERVTREFDAARYLYVGLLMAGVGGQYVGGKISSRLRVEKTLAATFFLLSLVAIGFVPLAELGTVPLVVVAGTFGFLLFALQPLYQAAIADHTPESDRGLSYGLTYFSNFGVGALGAAITGILLTRYVPQTVFWLLATIPLVGAILSLYVLFEH